MEFLWGRQTANFIRGPMCHSQGSAYQKDLSNYKMNLGGPSRSVRQLVKGDFTISNGVIGKLLSTFLQLINGRFEVDDRTKRVIGGSRDYDVVYIKANPDPKPEDLRGSIVTEAAVSYLTTLCNKVSMPVAIN